MSLDPKREVLRHLLATVAFRCRVAIADAPPDFADFQASDSTRTPAELLAHIEDLVMGTQHLLKGEFVELVSQPLPWDNQVARLFAAIKDLDSFLASDEPLAYAIEKFVQGPVGDALTHVGQIVLLRRLAGAPIQPEPYFEANIVPGNY